MTTLMARPGGPDRTGHLWGSMPGWGIVADLTPPEIAESRRLVVLRRLLAAGLVVVLLLCVGAYMLVRRGYAAAEDQLNAATQQSSQLTAQQGRYSEVTQVEAATGVVQNQLATLMAHDVDSAALVLRLFAALPAGMTVSSMNISFTGGAQSSGAPATGNSIGTVTLSGNARSLNDLATYSSRLALLPGVVDVLPVSNMKDGSGHTTWSSSVALTPKLYTHRFDNPASTGGSH